MGEASGEGGLLIEGFESDGYEGLGQVPLRILLPSNSQSPLGHKLVIRDEGVAMQNEDGEKEEDWGEEANVSWEESCLARFSKFLGFSTVGYEELILDFMNRINGNRQKIKGKGGGWDFKV